MHYTSIHTQVCFLVSVTCICVHKRMCTMATGKFCAPHPATSTALCIFLLVFGISDAELGGCGCRGRLGGGGGAVYARHLPRLHILVVISLTW